MLPTCCGEIVKNTAGGKDFLVCRGCKQEINPDSKSFAHLQQEISKINEKIQAAARIMAVPQVFIGGQQAPSQSAVTAYYFHGHILSAGSGLCAHGPAHKKDIDWAINNNMVVPPCPWLSSYGSLKAPPQPPVSSGAMGHILPVPRAHDWAATSKGVFCDDCGISYSSRPAATDPCAGPQQPKSATPSVTPGSYTGVGGHKVRNGSCLNCGEPLHNLLAIYPNTIPCQAGTP